MNRKIITVCISMLGLLKANAQTPDTINISTGVNATTGAVLPVNTVEPRWSSSGALRTCYLSAWNSSGGANWISPNVNTSTGQATNNAPGTTYSYSMSFTADSCPISGGQIRLNMLGGDNAVTNIRVNTTNHTVSAGFNSGSSPAILGATNITLTSTELTAGPNTITVTVSNFAGSYTGLLLDGSLIINYTANGGMVNNLSGPSQVCLGDDIIMDGSASTGPVGDHVWTVVECNSLGVAVPGATVWWSPFYPGSPGTYTIPSPGSGGPTLVCNKYYAVGMALQNSCNIWVPNQKVVKINCLPAANAGADKTICEGQCTTIGAGRTSLGVYYNWTTTVAGTVVSVGSGKPITVCPTTTTTYTLTASEDEITGCSATDEVTVTVVPPTHATFGYSDDPTPLTYYTVTVTPTYPAEASQPGWGDTWVIQERDPANPATVLSSTSSGSDPNPNCWWSYGAPHSFAGFNGTINVNCGGGTPSPAIGQFLYGHYYMIIRTTWNTACGWTQSSFPSYRATRSADAPAAHGISTQTNASELVDIAAGINTSAKESNLNVYPNPSNGIFTIELNNSTKTNMEIFDMLGNKVKEAQITGNYQLDLSGYLKGIYMIKMMINDKAVMKKIVLE